MKQNLLSSLIIKLLGALTLFYSCYGPIAAYGDAPSTLSPWGLYGGMGLGIAEHNTHLGAHSYQPELCINSYIIRKIEVANHHLGIGIGSFAQYGPYVKDITLQPQNSAISGKGSYTSASVGPRIHYFFKWERLPDKIVSLSAGYLISEQSFKVKKKSTSGEEEVLGQKITYEGHGYFIGLSFYEEKIKEKEFPFFAEFNFKYLRGKKETVVGGTQFEVKPLLKDNDGPAVREITLMFLLGLKFI